MTEETKVFFGDAVKALGNGKVAGYLVRFSTENEPDLEGDFFTAKTEFGTNITPPVVYHHGMDNALKSRIIGSGEIKADEVGLWIEAQLNMRDEYEKAIYQMVEAGKAGWSSGAISHLFEAVPTEKARWLKTWVIGEASITPTPAEPKNNVLPLKALAQGDENVTADAESDSEKTELDNKDNEMPDETKVAVETADKVDITEMVNEAVDEKMKAWQDKQVVDNAGVAKNVNMNLKTKKGDSYSKAFAYWAKSGDGGALKASNDSDMNVGTDADGGYAVPTGHYRDIIARRDESMLATMLGVRNIPGIGTTVNVPIDGEADGEFVATGEASAFDRDAPVLGQKAMTLVKYTKKIELSYELLNDEDSRLMAFLADFVGRGMAKTHNSLLLTEVAANGTEFKEFASTGDFAAGELESLVYNDDLAPYLDDTNSVAWVMRPTTFAKIASVTGNDRLYAETPAGSFAPSILGYPAHWSNKAAALAASAKSLYFGNWNYVGKREAPGFTVLRDPYSKAGNGQVVLHYYFRTVYGVLQSEAIGYGAMASA